MQFILAEVIFILVSTVMYRQILQYHHVKEFVVVRSFKLALVNTSLHLFVGLLLLLFIDSTNFSVITFLGIALSFILVTIILRRRMFISKMKALLHAGWVSTASPMITLLLMINLR